MQRSVSVYTLSAQQQGSRGGGGGGAVDGALGTATSNSHLPPAMHAHQLPRSTSLQRLHYHHAHAGSPVSGGVLGGPSASPPSTSFGGSPFATATASSSPFHHSTRRHHARGPSLQQHFAAYAASANAPGGGVARMRKPVSSASVEVLDDDDDTPAVAPPAARRASNELKIPSHLLYDTARRSRSGPHAVSDGGSGGVDASLELDDDPLSLHGPGVLLTSPTSSASSTSTVHPNNTLHHSVLSSSPDDDEDEQDSSSTDVEPSADSPELRSSSAARPIHFPSGGKQTHATANNANDAASAFMVDPVSMRSGNALVHPPPTLQLGSSIEHGEGAGSFSSSSLLFDGVGRGVVSDGDAGGALQAASSSLPASLIEDFDIVGRAGDNNTCDSWIVRSKFSGKMAVFKPRDGEIFEEKKKWDEAEEERLERERRRAKAGGNGKLFGLSSGATTAAASRHHAQQADPTALSTSCPLPHPLSIPPHLRTPIKRGVLYGETTRKEVAAYLMDHEHFARVPKTLEATIWLQQHEAPGQGRLHAGSNNGTHHPHHSDDAHHPYGHSVAHHRRQMLALNSASPPLGPQQAPAGRLLLQAPTISPALQPQAAGADPTLFAFEQEEWMAPAAIPSNSGELPQSESEGGRSLFGRSASVPPADAATVAEDAPQTELSEEEDHQLAPPSLLPPTKPQNVRIAAPPAPRGAAADPSNVQSPPSPLPASVSPSIDPALPSSFQSPDLVATTGSTPDDISSLGQLGLGLPASTAALIATYGSLQEYVENGGSAEDMGSAAFNADEVHRIGILDVRLLNLDRHLGNILVQRDAKGAPHLIPIDHSFCLPSYTELQDVHLEWTYWRQCSEPFSPATLRYIARLDPIADAAKLRNLGIRDEALVSMVFSSLLLQHAAREGLPLFHIARMVQRDGDGEEPSTLEIIVSRVLGFQQSPGESPSPTGSTTFDFASPSHANNNNTNLPSVVEEDHMHSSSSGNVSPSASTASSFQPMGSPPMSPSASASNNNNNNNFDSSSMDASSTSGSCLSSLLTRSNSDGAMALAEAISRQSSAPGLMQRTNSEHSQHVAASSTATTASSRASSQSQAGSSPPSASSARLPGQGAPSSKRRNSLADAAKQLIDEASAAAAMPSPAAASASGMHSASSLSGSPPGQQPPPAPYSRAFSSGSSLSSSSSLGSSGSLSSPSSIGQTVTPPPGPMLRLASALDDPHASYSPSHAHGHPTDDASGLPAITSGAKLQHLLHVTESVIREELQAYCAREGLVPSPTSGSNAGGGTGSSANASPTKASGNRSAHTDGSTSVVLPPTSSPRKRSGSPHALSPRDGSVVLNATVRPPLSPLRGFTPSAQARSVSADAVPPDAASSLPVSPPSATASAAAPWRSSSLAASLRRTRSTSIEQAAANASGVGKTNSSPRMPVRAMHAPPSHSDAASSSSSIPSSASSSSHNDNGNNASDALSPTEEASARRHSLRSPIASSPTEILA